MSLKHGIKKLLRPHGREAFLDSLPKGAHVLDVGCGSNSPYLVKMQRPDLYYVGLDVGDYNQTVDPTRFADEYILTPPEKFADAIAALGCRFDAVISSHNIEHCDDPDGVLTAMSRALRKSGRLYMSWPSEPSLHFPSRKGCLNFHDDPTHQHMPSFDAVVGTVEREGAVATFKSRTYKPPLPWLVGLLLEPISSVTKKKVAFMQATWAFYGFESVVFFSKNA